MYEHRSRPPLTRGAFFLRMLRHFLIAVAFVGVSLGAGMIGYLYFEHDHVKTWRDAFLNAGMLLGGMGPVHNPAPDRSKVFAGLYALYAGLVFLVVAALLLTPIFHRLRPPISLGQPAQNVRPHRAASSGDSRAD